MWWRPMLKSSADWTRWTVKPRCHAWNDLGEASGIVVTTPANVADCPLLPDLLDGEELKATPNLCNQK